MTQTITANLSRRELSDLLHSSTNTISKDEELLKRLLKDFREQWEAENYTPYICWVLSRIRYESRANRWHRRHGRDRLKKWIRANREKLTYEAFCKFQTIQQLNQP